MKCWNYFFKKNSSPSFLPGLDFIIIKTGIFTFEGYPRVFSENRNRRTYINISFFNRVELNVSTNIFYSILLYISICKKCKIQITHQKFVQNYAHNSSLKFPIFMKFSSITTNQLQWNYYYYFFFRTNVNLCDRTFE